MLHVSLCYSMAAAMEYLHGIHFYIHAAPNTFFIKETYKTVSKQTFHKDQT